MSSIILKRYFQISSTLCFLFLFLSVFFYVKDQEENRSIDLLISRTTNGNNLTSRQDTVLAISLRIFNSTKRRGIDRSRLGCYEAIESTSFFNVSSAVSLKYGGYGIKGHSVYGPCGTMSRILLNALWRLNIPARKLYLLHNAEGKGGGHTMIEFHDGHSWLVLAPSDSSFVWKNSEGKIATVEEIRDDHDVFSQIYESYPDYPYLFDNPKNIRWDKIPTFLKRFFEVLLGKEAYERAVTPKLYDQPRKLFFLSSFILSLFSGATSFASRALLTKLRATQKKFYRIPQTLEQRASQRR